MGSSTSAMAAALFAFTDSGGPGEFRGFFQNPNLGR
jgi:hypothetical protein